MDFATLGLVLWTGLAQQVRDTPSTEKEEPPLVQGGVVPPMKSLMHGDHLRIELLDPASPPGQVGASFEGSARLFYAFDSPAAQALERIERIPEDLAPFSALPVRVVDGEVGFPVEALGDQTTLSLFVARATSEGVLVSPIVDVTVTSPGLTAGRVDPARIAVFANALQPQSMDVAAAYVEQRDIPPENLVVVAFNEPNPDRPAIRESEFLSAIQPAIDALPPEIDLIALSWTLPYKVLADEPPAKVMSITSAFMFGTGPGQFVESVQGGCVFPSEFTPSPLYDLDARDYGAAGLPRPTMILGGEDTAQALALVARGVASDGTHPTFHGYLVSANAPRSNPRVPDMQATLDVYAGNSGFDLDWFEIGGATHPTGSGLLLYQTGDFLVEDIGLNDFLPGAVADNLDSWSGNLEAELSGHMNLMRWMSGGVTGSYGTVREPCAFSVKFPQTSVLVEHYFAGESLAEAYVKSVLFPQEGVFVGDPAACPYCR